MKCYDGCTLSHYFLTTMPWHSALISFMWRKVKHGEEVFLHLTSLMFVPELNFYTGGILFWYDFFFF